MLDGRELLLYAIIPLQESILESFHVTWCVSPEWIYHVSHNMFMPWKPTPL